MLFAANRWEVAGSIEADLRAGVTVIADRYTHSGAAYGVAKGLPVSWCAAPDSGLPVPDVVIYLAINPVTAMSRMRDGESREKYERVEFQYKVAAAYMSLYGPNWHIVDASLDVAGTQNFVRAAALEAIDDVKKSQ